MTEEMKVGDFMEQELQQLKEIDMSLAPAVVFHKVPNSLPSRFDIFVQIIQTEMVLLTLEELSSRLQMDETNAGRKDHDADEEALIVRIRSTLQGRNRYAYSPWDRFSSQLKGSSSYFPREGTCTGTS